MSRRDYGQGNGPGWAKRKERARHVAQHVREVDERDVGVRADVGRVLGFDGEVEFYWVDGYPMSREEYERRERFRKGAHSWFKRAA